MLKKIWTNIKYILEPISKVMSNVINFISLSIVYFIGIGSVSIVMKIFRKHFLELKKQNKKSNWHEHKLTKQPLGDYYRTFWWKMNILGISCFYHDAAACLMKNGIVVAAAEEEIFTRIKHDISFPVNAINYCLKEGNININQVDYVGFYEKPLLKFERLLSQHLEMFPRSFWSFYKALPSWLNEKLRIPSIIRKKIKYKGDILFIEHHLAHVASVFLVSPYEESAILTVDGVGEWATASYGYGKGNEITLLKELRFPNSVGLLYSTVTAHLGFSVNNSEYKVMGLSPYGKPNYYDKFKKIVNVKEDGSIEFDMSYFDYHYKLTMPSRKFVEEFGVIRKPNEEVTQRHKDIAASS